MCRDQKDGSRYYAFFLLIGMLSVHVFYVTFDRTNEIVINSAFNILIAIAAIITLIFTKKKNDDKNRESDINILEKQLSQIYYPLILILSKIKTEINNIQYYEEINKILNMRSILDSKDRGCLEILQKEIISNFDTSFIDSKLDDIERRKNEIENDLDDLKK